MSLWKIRPKFNPTNFLFQWIHNVFHVAKKLGDFWNFSKKQTIAQEAKIRPNLVTLKGR
jgi:hypothetical protein